MLELTGAAAGVCDGGAVLPACAAVARPVGDAEVARSFGVMVEVEGRSRRDREPAAGADRLAGSDEASRPLPHSLVRAAVAATRAILRRPLRSLFWRRAVLAAVGGMARPGGPAAASTGLLVQRP